MAVACRFGSLPVLSTVVVASLVLAGCGSVGNRSDEEKLGYKPQEREIQSAKDQVNDISSRLLDLMGVKGKVTEPSAAVNFCETVDPDLQKYYAIHHPWSVYDLEAGTFGQAMENLRRALPEHGWKITKDGETNSIARNPEIIAVNKKSRHTITVEWAKERSGDLKQIIAVDVSSRCYRAPEGTDISEEK
ncbi:hypothetical protein [Streptomyces sp. NPDC053720]|uniref:hypothetical protein n=1 Tax=Streptomyces sp. NPDC053720 TaxID=3154855 RepID=UPI003420CA49